MKITLKQLGSPWVLLLMLFVAMLSAFEILITWNSGVGKDYPGFIPVIITLLIISTTYLIWYFRRASAD